MVTDMLDPPPSLTELEGRIDALESRIERLERVLEDSDTEAKESAGDNNSDIYSEGKSEGEELDGAANVTNGNGDNNGVPRIGDCNPSVPTDGDVGLLSDKGAEPVAEADEEKKAEAQASTQTFEVTAYTAGVESTGKAPGDVGYGVTASGEEVREGYTLACPPSLPFGTKVAIEGVGERVCTDRGSDITEGRLDVYMPELEDALEFGRQTLEVRISEN